MRGLSAVLLLLAAGCAGPRAVPAPGPSSVPSALRAVAEPAEVKDPNFVLIVLEVVPNPDDDGVSFTKVFADGKEMGKTAVGRKSEPRALKLKLPAGNLPIRLEHWTLPEVGEWTHLDDSLQPRERFVRIEEGSVVKLELRFAEGEVSNALTLSREPVSR